MKALLKSFSYAFHGIYVAIRNERNMRIHIVCMCYMYFFLLAFDWFVLSRLEFAILFLANAIVIMAELVNTAIEAVIDLETQNQFHTLAKIAKDAAAAAVLVGAIFAVAVGIALLWQPEAFRMLYSYFSTHLWALAALLISFVLSGLFIFLPQYKGRDTA